MERGRVGEVNAERHIYRRTQREEKTGDSVGGWSLIRLVRRDELIHEMDSPISSVQRLVALICIFPLASRFDGVRDPMKILQITLHFLKLVNFVNFANLSKFENVSKAFKNRKLVNFANLVNVFAKSFDLRFPA